MIESYSPHLEVGIFVGSAGRASPTPTKNRSGVGVGHDRPNRCQLKEMLPPMTPSPTRPRVQGREHVLVQRLSKQPFLVIFQEFTRVLAPLLACGEGLGLLGVGISL